MAAFTGPCRPDGHYGKMTGSPAGRTVGIVFADGSDAAATKALREAAEAVGARAKLVAPKVGGARA